MPASRKVLYALLYNQRVLHRYKTPLSYKVLFQFQLFHKVESHLDVLLFSKFLFHGLFFPHPFSHLSYLSLKSLSQLFHLLKYVILVLLIQMSLYQDAYPLYNDQWRQMSY